MATYALLILITTLALFSSRASSHPAAKHPGGIIKAPLVHKIANMRWRTNQLLRQKCRPTWPVGIVPAYRIPVGMRTWVIDVWGPRLDAAIGASSRCNDVGAWISHYFGSRAGEARVVAECESTVGPAGLYAVNGQYVGVFQMGEWERRNYGWYTVGAAAQTQVRSAHNYFVASGSDWSPWECQP